MVHINYAPWLLEFTTGEKISALHKEFLDKESKALGNLLLEFGYIKIATIEIQLNELEKDCSNREKLTSVLAIVNQKLSSSMQFFDKLLIVIAKAYNQYNWKRDKEIITNSWQPLSAYSLDEFIKRNSSSV